jgi:quercetin 2,3-dioxygenase
MWWNFVGRTREEIERAYRDWRDATGRFGDVASSLARIAAPPPNWIPM